MTLKRQMKIIFWSATRKNVSLTKTTKITSINKHTSHYSDNIDIAGNVNDGNDRNVSNDNNLEHGYMDDAGEDDNTNHNYITYTENENADDDGSINWHINVIANDVKSDKDITIMTKNTLRRTILRRRRHWRQQLRVCDETTTRAASSIRK